MPPKGFRVLPRRWVVERTIACPDLPQQEDGQRLREIVRNRGGLCLRGDDAADGEAIGPCVRLSRQSLEGVFSEVRSQKWPPGIFTHCAKMIASQLRPAFSEGGWERWRIGGRLVRDAPFPS